MKIALNNKNKPQNNNSYHRFSTQYPSSWWVLFIMSRFGKTHGLGYKEDNVLKTINL